MKLYGWLPACCLLTGVTQANANFLVRKFEAHRAKFTGLNGARAGLLPGLGDPMVNPWAKTTDFRVLDDLKPVAPMDKVEGITDGWVVGSGSHSITGAAPLGPGEKGAKHPEGYQVYDSTMPDLVPMYSHPRDFPYDQEWSGCKNDVTPNIADRDIVAKSDRQRPFGRFQWRPIINYPNKAPSDRFRPGPFAVASEDRVPDKYAKYFEQVYDDESLRLCDMMITDLLKASDTDKDGSISPQEWQALVIGHQQKTESQANSLWGRYHTTLSEDMTEKEFRLVAATGFDLGKVQTNRTDLTTVLTPGGMVDMGFWGGASVCLNKYVKGAQIQATRANHVDSNADNTGLNNVVLKCDDDSDLTSMGTSDGDPSAWIQCPDGENIYGFRVKSSPYVRGQDNSAINDIEFVCRTKDNMKTTYLRFGNPDTTTQPHWDVKWANYSIVGDATTDANNATNPAYTADGGWTTESNCGPSGYVCGIMTRVLTATGGNEDGQGIVDLRLFCCLSTIACDAPCGINENSMECTACKDQAKGDKPLTR